MENKLKIKCLGCGQFNLIDRTKLRPGPNHLKCKHCEIGFKIIPELDEQLPLETPSKKAENPMDPAAKKSEGLAGWLFAIDTRATGQSFDLQIGDNNIGRLSKDPEAYAEVNIAIRTDDLTMSRRHCTLQIKIGPDKRHKFILQDRSGLAHAGRVSNLRDTRLLGAGHSIYLFEGDCIELGRTHLVLKTANDNRTREEAERSAHQKAAAHTEILGK